MAKNMDGYNVIITSDAEEDLNNFIAYLLYVKCNEQAAKAVWDDAIQTREELAKVAGSLKLCTDERLKQLGYKKIHFLKHRYLMIFRIENDNVYVDAIYHELQDYENIFAERID